MTKDVTFCVVLSRATAIAPHPKVNLRLEFVPPGEAAFSDFNFVMPKGDAFYLGFELGQEYSVTFKKV